MIPSNLEAPDPIVQLEIAREIANPLTQKLPSARIEFTTLRSWAEHCTHTQPPSPLCTFSLQISGPLIMTVSTNVLVTLCISNVRWKVIKQSPELGNEDYMALSWREHYTSNQKGAVSQDQTHLTKHWHRDTWTQHCRKKSLKIDTYFPSKPDNSSCLIFLISI